MNRKDYEDELEFSGGMPTVYTDSYLLDLLAKLPIPAGFGWQLRPSSTGRGYRLMTTRRTPNYPTPRAAIAAAICPDCDGDGTVPHDNCQAGDQVLQEYVECGTCGGSRIVG